MPPPFERGTRNSERGVKYSQFQVFSYAAESGAMDAK